GTDSLIASIYGDEIICRAVANITAVIIGQYRVRVYEAAFETFPAYCDSFRFIISYTGFFLLIVTGILPLWAAVIIYVINLCRDFAIDCLRMIAATKGTVLAANMFGKIKTTIAFVALPWLLLQGCLPSNWVGLSAFQIIGYILIALQTIFCLLSGVIYLVQNRQVLSDVKA
ncbi:MAG: hypothetical protein MJ054_01920, partial [Clostridia bacterium]|nr:hypothetical protein [Clostridia bacterium]